LHGPRVPIFGPRRKKGPAVPTLPFCLAPAALLACRPARIRKPANGRPKVPARARAGFAARPPGHQPR